jgi:RNA polymerase sigma-70 factor (ECF subfamily)
MKIFVLKEQDIENTIQLIAISGDQKAFRKLFDHFFLRLYRFAGSIVKDQHQAQEVVQDVFLKIWENREHLTSVCNIQVYLYTVTKNKSIDYLRVRPGERTGQFLPDQMEATIESWNAESKVISEERIRTIEESISSLPPRSRLVLQMVKQNGMKYSEVATLLGISIKTVEAHMSVAIRKLMKSLQHEFPQFSQKV